MSCNRLRLTSDGKLRNCLFSLEETDVRGCSAAAAGRRDREGHPRLRRREVGRPRDQHRAIHPAGTADALDRRLESRTMSKPESESPWYQDGLAFSCTRCGACCTGAPGYVWVSPEEIGRLAEFRGQTARRVRREVRAPGWAAVQPDRKTRRRLYFLGQGQAARSTLPGRCSVKRGRSGRKMSSCPKTGSTSDRSARARVTADCIRLRKSSRRFPGTKMTDALD